MKTVTLTEAKAGLSGLLRRVARGEVILILSRGQPVARLSPPLDVELGTSQDRMARLEKDGIVRRGTRPPSLDFLRLPAPRLTPRQGLLAALLDEREEGR